MAVDHPFAIVPLRMLGTVSASAVCVYAVLAEAANSHQVSWPSKATIGERTGLSARQVQRCTAELRDAGWIRVEERSRSNGSQASNAYVVLRAKGDTSVSPPRDIAGSHPEPLMTPLEPDPLEPDPDGVLFLNSVGHPQAADEHTDDEDDPFDAWWSEYPRKVQKVQARKAYARAAKKVSHERLLEAMRTYRDFDSRVAEGYIQHASTWLNNESWDDEIVQSPQSDEERQWALLRGQMDAGTGDAF